MLFELLVGIIVILAPLAAFGCVEWARENRENPARRTRTKPVAPPRFYDWKVEGL